MLITNEPSEKAMMQGIRIVNAKQWILMLFMITVIYSYYSPVILSWTYYQILV